MAAGLGERVTLGPLALVRTTHDRLIAHLDAETGRGRQVLVAFCNAHTAVLAFRDDVYCRLLNAMLVVNDGVGIDLAAKLLDGARFPENLNGTDFVPRWLDAAPPQRIFLLGARPEVVANAARHIARAYPRHTVTGHRHGFFEADDTDAIVHAINASGAGTLLVAMGNPRQERFMAAHAASLDCRLVMGVGALFDFMTGRVPRAPLPVRRLRLEWLYRLAREPRRLWRRYTLDAAEFCIRILLFAVRRAPRTRG